ncbi:MAG: PLP-dependent aminotransferase family protein [Sphingobium sp.]|nr:PLP-dependent aminotransferase family protein [Sphingobium sp.]
MTRAIVHPLWGSLSLDRDGEGSLQTQVVAYFRAAIIEGRLRRGLRLPSSRQLARDHDISRTTAVEAYERLIAEGYLVSRPGSGIFIAERIPEDFTPENAARPAKAARVGSRSRHVEILDLRNYQMPLAPGQPAVDLFPWTEWNRHMAAVLRGRPHNEIAHGDPFGERPLREAIADYLAAMKGIRCDPAQIVVVGGTVQIFDLAFELMRDFSGKALIEDPVYPFVRLRIPRLGFELVGAPVDDHGMDVGQGIAMAPYAKFAFVSPSHNVPSGACLSLERRQKLVDWADQTGAWIFENEFDGDFRFTSRPLPTCYSLSRTNRVILIGSMSKPFAPGLRVGYLLLPHELLTRAHEIVVPQATVSTQLAMARLCASGSLATHLRHLRTVHEHRRDLLLAAIDEHLSGLVELVHAPEAGLRVVVSLPDGTDDLGLVMAAHHIEVKLEALSGCYVDRPRQSGLMMGFGSTPEGQIAPAVERLAGLIRAHLADCASAATA